MADIHVKCIPNGPYRVAGPFKIVDPTGNEIIIEEGARFRSAAAAAPRTSRSATERTGASVSLPTRR